VDLTTSYNQAFGPRVLSRYTFFETRNAAKILAATNPARCADVAAVLDAFALRTDDLVTAGRNESALAARLNTAFRQRGWRESRVDTVIRLSLVKNPYRPAGETTRATIETEVVNEGYLVDNFVDRVALDVEWNAKDGNLDRDLGAYRSLYDSGLIDAAVMITRTSDELRALGYRLGVEAGMTPANAKKILGTTTTTNTDKLVPRLQRGDGGGCPILVAAICEATWEGGQVPEEPEPRHHL
jgi:hypothetical protein